MIRIVVAPSLPLEPQLADAVAALRRDEVVAFPTDTLYGLAADPRSARALERLLVLKGRGAEKTIALVAANLDQAERVAHFPPAARAVVTTFWPGPLTVLLRAREGLDPAVVGERGLVGVRVPCHDVALALLRAFGHPLTATSANRTGDPATDEPQTVAQQLPELDVLIDAGRSPGGSPSTIVDLSGGAPRLVRAGAMPWERVLESSRPAS